MKEKYPGFPKWQEHAEENQTDEDIRKLYEKRGNANVAYSYITGFGGLIDIDFDWPIAYHAVVREFGERMNTFTIRTPNGGFRCLYITDDPYSMLDYKSKPPHVEIHGDKGKHQVIVHGQALNEQGILGNYEVINDAEIRHDNEIIEDMVKFLGEINLELNFLEYNCIANNLKGKKIHLTHEERTNIAMLFVANGVDFELAVDFFRICTDFDEEITRQHLTYMYDKDFKHPTCETLKKNFNCSEDGCKRCIRKSSTVSTVKTVKMDKNSQDESTLPTKIVDEITSKCTLFTDERDVAYVRFSAKGHTETLKVKSRQFSNQIYKIARELNNNNIPSTETVNSAINYLEAVAFHESKKELSNRVARKEDDIWYDLSNEQWQAIKINLEGWIKVSNPPSIFRREIHQLPQVEPVAGGDPWKFFDFVNISDDKKLLVLVYIVCCMIPGIPHPVLIVHGSPGSGKSLTMEFIRQIIDPSLIPRLTVPKGDKDLVQNFDHHYATFFDNLDTIPGWLSDKICRAVTGENSEYRALYTNDEPILRSFRRCVAINGVNIAATRTDLLDRSILLKLNRIPNEKRQGEEFLRKEFQKALPEIFGGILDVIVKAMQIYPNVELKNLPRMADFAKWGYAVAEALGYNGEDFIEAYAEDEEERLMESAENNPLALAVMGFIEEHNECYETPGSLLEKLNIWAETENLDINSKLWPKSPVWLSRRLNEIEALLADSGIYYINIKEGKQRTIRLAKVRRKNTDDTDVLSSNESKLPYSKKEPPPSSNFTTVNERENDGNFDSKNHYESPESKKDVIAVESVKDPLSYNDAISASATSAPVEAATDHVAPAPNAAVADPERIWKRVLKSAAEILADKAEKGIYPILFRAKLGDMINEDEEDVLLDFEVKLIDKGWIRQDLKSRIIKPTKKLLRNFGG